MVNRGRDDFPHRTRATLAKRVGYSCSICQVMTVGPSAHDSVRVNSVGVAAHIAGARPGSARYDPSMTPEQRRDINNGIWLCQLCAKKIDGDSVAWTIERLQRVKAEAEQRALAAMAPGSRRGLGAVLVHAQFCQHVRHFRGIYVPVDVINERAKEITVSHVGLRVAGADYGATGHPVSFSVERAWLQPPPVRLKALDALIGAWWFSVGFHSDEDPFPPAVVSAELQVVPVRSEPIVTSLEFLHAAPRVSERADA